ncbi:hypothetical protein PENTCL1PPCAC_20549, partial [Pristionchus entomophagus]
MSFMDLPDDIHICFFKYLDFSSRNKLRLNKRLDGLQMCVKNKLYSIELKIFSDRYELKLVNSSDDVHESSHTPRQYSDFNQLVEGLNRLSLNRPSLISRLTTYNLSRPSLISRLTIYECFRFVFFQYNDQLILPQLDLSTLHNFAQNASFVYID